MRRGRAVTGHGGRGRPGGKIAAVNTLSFEFKRLFGAGPQGLVGPGDTVRALVLALAQPADWDVLSRVCRGVQTELALPAPAIAVSGTDALQLWFSLAEPLAAAQAHGFLVQLCQRFLPDIDPRRLRLLPSAGASAARQDGHAAAVPALQPGTDNWSAFVAPDLAPVFGETPWLDIAPGEEGQANLLRAIAPIEAAAFAAAAALLRPVPMAEPVLAATPAPAPAQAQAPAPAQAAAGSDTGCETAALARAFLCQVMQDAASPLALRIEAAKALLPRSGG